MFDFSNRKKSILASFLGAFLVLLLGGFFVFRAYQTRSLEKAATQEYRKTLSDYRNMKADNVDFLAMSRKVEGLLERHSGMLSSEEEGQAKFALANLLVPYYNERAIDLFKELAQSERYPNAVRALALNGLIDDYEVNFIYPDRGKRIFTGEGFENLLSESGGDLSIAIRKLSEQSVSLTPNAIAHYRITKWYASELNKNTALSEEEKTKLKEKINEHIIAGDPLLRPGAPPDRLGLAYALKARVLSLAGDKPEEVEKLFRLSMEAYSLPPITIWKVMNRAYGRFYYAAFLARTYGSSRAEDISTLLRPQYEFLKTPQDPLKRAIRRVSFLIAARDSKAVDYPAPDFNQADVLRLGKIYPELGMVVDGLNLTEYLRGVPGYEDFER